MKFVELDTNIPGANPPGPQYNDTESEELLHRLYAASPDDDLLTGSIPRSSIEGHDPDDP